MRLPRHRERALVTYDHGPRASAHERRCASAQRAAARRIHVARHHASNALPQSSGLTLRLVPARKAHYANALVLVSAGALAASVTSSPTRDDLVFALGAWLLFVASTTVCGSVMLALLFGTRWLLRRRMARDSGIAIATIDRRRSCLPSQLRMGRRRTQGLRTHPGRASAADAYLA